MIKLACVTLCVLTLTLCPFEIVFGQDDELPYNPFLDKQLESQPRHGENRAMRDLGGSAMNTVVGIPSEVKDELRVTQKVSAKGERPIIILVYGRKESAPREAAMSEELQRMEVEHAARREGLREAGIQVKGDLRRSSVQAPPVK